MSLIYHYFGDPFVKLGTPIERTRAAIQLPSNYSCRKVHQIIQGLLHIRIFKNCDWNIKRMAYTSALIHQSVSCGYFGDWQHCRDVAMSTLAATTMLRTTRTKRDSVKSTSTFNMLLIQVTFKSLTNSSVHEKDGNLYCWRRYASCSYMPLASSRSTQGLLYQVLSFAWRRRENDCLREWYHEIMRAAQYAEKTSWLF